MLRLLPGTLSIALTFVVLTVTFMGLGLGVRRAFGLIEIENDDLFMAFWMGFAIVLLFLMLWNFALPVDGRALSVVMMGGASGLLVARAPLSATVRNLVKDVPRWMFALLALGLLWVANLSTGAMTNWDSALYHMQGVEWARNFRAVPGLANVFGPLGFNNGSFLYDAMIGSGPWFRRGWHVAGGLLVWVLLAQIMASAVRLRMASGWRAGSDVFTLLLLAPVINMAMGESLASYSTDIPRTAVRLVTIALIYRWLVRDRRDTRTEAYDLVRIVTLCAAGVAIKLSAVIFSTLLIVTTAVLWLRRRDTSEPIGASVIIIPVAVGLAFGTAWITRGIVLSGYPMFPSQVLPAPVEWRALADHARAEFTQVYHTGRATYTNLPFLSGQETGMGSWLPNWIHTLWDDPYYLLVPLALSLAALPFLWFAWRRAAPERRAATREAWWIMPAAVVAIVSWFFISPEPRYGIASWWTLTALVWAQTAVLGGWLEKPSSKRAVFAACCVVGLSPVIINPVVDWWMEGRRENLAKVIYHANLYVPPRSEWFGPVVGTPRTHPYRTSSGLMLNVPEGRCFDAPIPCTPNPAPNLRLRVAGHMENGFMVEGEWQMLHWPEPWRPTILPAFQEAWRRK